MNWPQPAQCDIHDQGGLAAFQHCLRLCKPALAGQDVNSIEQQLTELAWKDAVYRSFNEGLRLNRKSKAPHPVPASVVDLLHERYFWSQVILLRRLFEKKASRLHKAVYSLPTILGFLKDSAHSLTREAYVCYDGTPYSPQDTRHTRQTVMLCSGRHRMFDTLTGRITPTRGRDETVSDLILPALSRWDDVPSRLDYYANKYAAHAADPANRTRPGVAPRLLTLNYLQNLHKTAVWMALALGKLTDQLVLIEVATPQFDQFDHWDGSLFNPNTKRRLYHYWKSRVALIRGWSHTY